MKKCNNFRTDLKYYHNINKLLKMYIKFNNNNNNNNT